MERTVVRRLKITGCQWAKTLKVPERAAQKMAGRILEAMEVVMDSRILQGLQNQGHSSGKSQQTHC